MDINKRIGLRARADEIASKSKALKDADRIFDGFDRFRENVLKQNIVVEFRPDDKIVFHKGNGHGGYVKVNPPYSCSGVTSQLWQYMAEALSARINEALSTIVEEFWQQAREVRDECLCNVVGEKYEPPSAAMRAPRKIRIADDGN